MYYRWQRWYRGLRSDGFIDITTRRQSSSSRGTTAYTIVKYTVMSAYVLLQSAPVFGISRCISLFKYNTFFETLHFVKQFQSSTPI